MAEDPIQALPYATGSASVDPTIINDRCVRRGEGDQRAVVVGGGVVSHFRHDDRMAAAHAMVTLVEQGIAAQHDVAQLRRSGVRRARCGDTSTATRRAAW